MATTPTAGSGDPSVLRQVERQNTALTAKPQLSSAPSVNGSAGTTPTTASRATRSIAPVVSGSEVLYPQSTTSTSSNAVIINSSVNNDVGDITTVYSSNGQITVNPINQTINQYTSVDSGVSQVIAGAGVTITSTGASGTGIVTINSVATTLGNIVSINLDGNAANVLHGDGTWSADQTTYGNSNVAAYLPTYTGNIGGNVVTANLLNVTGNVTISSGELKVNNDIIISRPDGRVVFVSSDGTSNGMYIERSTVDSQNWIEFSSVNSGNDYLRWGIPGLRVYSNVGSSPTLSFTANAAGVTTTNVTVTGNITATNLGNISAINLTGSNANVLYGNGVFAPASGGGSSSELVNGNNSLVLDGDGNIVLEGTPSGNAINRGLVWDYGANANGVNSTLRQDNGGLILRAWTENGGGANGYSAPVSIVTNQDATAKQWIFEGDGNLTVPTGSINSINSGGDLGAYLTLTPELGLARLAGRDAQANVGYTSTSWSNATYTGTQVTFTDAPNLVAFFNNNQFNDGVNQIFSINGGEPVPFTGYSIGVGNTVVVDTNVTPEPDPTTVTSINFYSQLESYIAIDYDGNELNINATGLTILIDNDQTEGPDITLRSGDDITLQAKDMSLGSEREGGDINLNAGNGADDDGLGNTASGGGDIIIDAGLGGDGNSSSGGTGGFTQIRGGNGGSAGVTNLAGGGGYVEIGGGDGGSNTGNTQLGASGGDVNIYGGDTTREGFNGASVYLTSGAGGPNAFAGSVNISTPSSDEGPGGLWQFDGAGLLTLPDGAIIDTIGNNFEVRAVENVNFEANAVVNIYTDTGNAAYQWQFGDDGNLTLPGNTFAVNYANGTQVSIGGGGANTGNVTFDNNIVIGTGDEFGGDGLFLAPGNGSIANSAVQYLRVRGGDAPTHIHLDTGNNQFYDQYFGDDAKYVKLELGDAGNIVVGTDDAAGNSYNWTFTSGGNLILANGNGVIQSIANSSLDILNPNVSTMVLTPDPGYGSQALVLDPTTTGHIHLRAPGANIDEPSANIFLGGEASSFEVGEYNGAVPNLFIHSNNNTWMFDIDGNITFPRDGSNISTDPYLKILGGPNPQILSEDASLAGPANLAIVTDYLNLSGSNGNRIAIYADNGEIGTEANMALYTNLADPGNIVSWILDTTGNLTLPDTSSVLANVSITLEANDTGNITGLSLIGDSNANLYAHGNVTIVSDSSNTTATWAFGADGNLTLPGNTFAVNYANGTQVSISGANTGNITFDQSTIESNQSNAFINLNAAGSGFLSLGTNDQANVRIVTDEGNVNNQWTFGTNGALTLPGGSTIDQTANVSTNINVNGNAWAFGVNGNLTLPGNIVTPNGANAVIPSTAGTAGAPLIISAGTGGIAATSLNAGNGGNLTINAGDAGSDIGNPSWGAIGGTLVLKAGNSTQPYTGSNVEIRSGNSASIPGAISLYTGANQWTFDATGNLTVPGSLINDTSVILSAPSIFNICTISTAGSGYNTGSSLKATTGGSGSGMTVGIGYGLSNQLTSVNVVDPGTGYVNGDVITVSEGTGGTFVLTKYNQSANQTNNNTIQTDFTFANSTVTLPIYGEMATDYSMTLTTNLANAGNTSSWTFGTDGNLTVPGNLVIAGNTSVFGTASALIQTTDNLPLIALSSGANGAVSSVWVEDVANVGTSNIAAVYANPTVGSGIVRIAVGQNGVGSGPNLWDFGATGNLTLPGNTFAVNYANGTQVSLGGGNVTWAQIDDKAGNSGPTIITLGQNAGFDGQGNAAIAIGKNAGQGGQGASSITIGEDAGGNTTQGANSVAIGRSAGFDAQGIGAVAIGSGAGSNSQGNQSVAIGENAGVIQGSTAVAIGQNAGGGVALQGDDAVAIGHSAGENTQGTQSVAIGLYAGRTTQGINSIAIGANAGITSQGNNSIILNATGANLNQTTANTFTVSPVRNDTSNIAEVMFYNTTSKEITYGNTISVAGNITGANFIGNLANGNSDVSIPAANGNINFDVAGNANVVVMTGTGANITGTLNVTGNITGNTNGFAIGYLNIPQVAAANATLALTDAGKHYYSTTAGNFTLTVPTNANAAFATGTAISIVVQAAGNVLVNAASGVTLYMAGNSSAANRVVGSYGMATLLKVASDTWFINGTGVA